MDGDYQRDAESFKYILQQLITQNGLSDEEKHLAEYLLEREGSSSSSTNDMDEGHLPHTTETRVGMIPPLWNKLEKADLDQYPR